jgi:hypothetical protein
MNSRAVIYVRTSSEHQGEKSSPAEQEADCRKLAADQGLVIVKVYRDVEKYRVKNKLVEPSGPRYDRPGLLAMLKARQKVNSMSSWRGERIGFIVVYAPCLWSWNLSRNTKLQFFLHEKPLIQK